MIDLDSYVREVEAMVALADDFVDRTSALRLSDTERDLRTGINAGLAAWAWQTRADIKFRPSGAYDGPGKHHVDTWLELGFKIDFARPAKVKKSNVWMIVGGATHLSIKKADGELPFHFDYKNSGQWGPQLHFQVSEDHGNLPIPRIPSAAFLPTDCVDIALAELHHDSWRQRQSAGASSAHMSVLRNAQEYRAMAYLKNIAKMWGRERQTTRLCMLQDYSASLAGLPDHRDRVPSPW